MRRPWRGISAACWVCRRGRIDHRGHRVHRGGNAENDSFTNSLGYGGCMEILALIQRGNLLCDGSLRLWSGGGFKRRYDTAERSGYLPDALHGMSSGRWRGNSWKLPAFSRVAASCRAFGGIDSAAAAWPAWTVGARWKNLQGHHAFVARGFDR